MSDTPRYAHAPVVLALIEIKHPSVALGRGDALALKNELRARLPFHASREVASQNVDFTPGGFAAGALVKTTVETFEARSRRTRLSCSPEATTIETTEYGRWTGLLETMRTALAARHEITPLDGTLRIGLRYIDEIRVDEPGDWTAWITPPFLAPVPDGGELVPAQQNCVVQYRTPTAGQTVTVRFGAVDAPPAVIGDLRADAPAPGPYFLMDTDIAWEVPGSEPVPEFDVDSVCQILDELHDHAVKMFEHVLTPKLREAIR